MTSGKQVFGKAKAGAVAGIVGGMALASSFMGIDSHLSVSPGTFYKIVGLWLGLTATDAISVGFLVHMATAALIGAVFFVCSILHKILNITSFQKGVFAGGVTGLVVFAVFFLPINLFIMIPSVQQIIVDSDQFGLSVQETDSIKKMTENTEQILWGSLILHVLYGVVMGFFSGIMLPEEYKRVQSRTE